MPYIKREQRVRLDSIIEELGKEIKLLSKESGSEHEFAGLLNYCCTKLALEVMPEKRYWAIALITGVFKNIADEFYRRVGVPYEDKKIKEEGDVY